MGFARQLALRQLSRGPRTRAQLDAALARRDVPVEVREAVLSRFEEVNLIDDRLFAELWVDSRRAGRGLGQRALAHELRQRGVDAALVTEAVGTITPDQELQMARELVRRRLPGTAGDDPARRWRRLAGLLARRGYPAPVAVAAIRAELSAEGDPDDEGVPELSAEDFESGFGPEL